MIEGIYRLQHKLVVELQEPRAKSQGYAMEFHFALRYVVPICPTLIESFVIDSNLAADLSFINLARVLKCFAERNKAVCIFHNCKWNLIRWLIKLISLPSVNSVKPMLVNTSICYGS